MFSALTDQFWLDETLLHILKACLQVQSEEISWLTEQLEPSENGCASCYSQESLPCHLFLGGSRGRKLAPCCSLFIPVAPCTLFLFATPSEASDQMHTFILLSSYLPYTLNLSRLTLILQTLKRIMLCITYPLLSDNGMHRSFPDTEWTS